MDRKIFCFLVAIVLPLLNGNTQSLKPPKTAIRENPGKWILMGGGSYHPSQVAGFGMISWCSSAGFFVKIKSNLRFDDQADETNNSSYYQDYYIIQKEKGRLALTAGVMINMKSGRYFYAGGGYGKRSLIWITVNGRKLKIKEDSYQGAEVESGLIFHIGKIAFSGGVSLSGLHYAEGNFAMGFIL